MKSNSVKPGKCQNCNQSLDEETNFCPNCGQKALPDHLTVRYFVQEFLNNYFSFDSKFLNTIRPLLYKPAFLSLEFIAGRRIRYINPVQLFIFISFLYFFVDSIFIFKEAPENISYITLTEKGRKDLSDSVGTVEGSQVMASPDSIPRFDKDFPMNDEIFAVPADSAEEGRDGLIWSFLEKSKRFNELDEREQTEKINKMVSYFVFILMPVFALLLGWFFRKGKRHFLESLIFSLHFHAFYFLLAIFIALFDRLLPGDVDDFLLLVLVIAYLFIAIRRFYGYKAGSTALRLTGLSVLYIFVVFICFIASIIISIMW